MVVVVMVVLPSVVSLSDVGLALAGDGRVAHAHDVIRSSHPSVEPFTSEFKTDS
jgi:hypothetical protein